MRVAPNVRSLKRRLDRFFWDNGSTEAVRLRALLHEDFGGFPRKGVIGGLVRDFARGGRSVFKSDIDLVIAAEPDDVDQLARRLGACPNRFGGYGYRAAPWNVDFWALRRTWAAVHEHVAVLELADVTRCVFFDWDAVVYELDSRQVLCEQHYLERIHNNRMEVNLRENPGVMGNLLKATRRIIHWNIEPGPKLSRFILEHLDEDAFTMIRKSERQKHSDWVLGTFADVAELKYALFHRESCGSDKEQMVLEL